MDFIPSGSNSRAFAAAAQSEPFSFPATYPAVVNGTFEYSHVERNDVDDFARPQRRIRSEVSVV